MELLPPNIRRKLKCAAIISVFALLLGVRAEARPQNSDKLTIERIFGKHEFDAKEFGPVVWGQDGESYTLQEPSKSVSGAQDIVRVSPTSGLKTIVVPARILVPPGSKLPLTVQSYEWSKDNRRLLLFTNTKKVWRDKTRGDYWVFRVSTRKLIKLGGNLTPSTLMFPKFSLDGKR